MRRLLIGTLVCVHALALPSLPHLHLASFRSVRTWPSAVMLLDNVPTATFNAALLSMGAMVGALARGNDLARFSPIYRRTPFSEIYVRPGKGKFGVGLICIQDVPNGARICKCFPEYSKSISMKSLDTLPPAVRETLHEMWDCVNDPPGQCLVPIDYDSAVPLIAFVNHDNRRPNCVYDPETNSIRAARDLRKGEEATVDYFDYQDETSYTYLHAASNFSPNLILSMYPDAEQRS